MYTVGLAEHEIAEIHALTRELEGQYSSVESEDFLRVAPTYAHDLPRGLRAALNDFRLLEPSGVCLIQGYPIDDERIGPTPAHWKDKPIPSPTLREELFYFLCACILGDPIGWATQQDGYILHDVLPIKGHEMEQLGSGSETLLTWHTEDAFHPYRADYLALMCLRNPDKVETTLASVEDVQLDDETLRVLSEARFVIRPDESHLKKNRSGSRSAAAAPLELLERSYARIDRMNTDPEKVAVLFGDSRRPYLRIDPYFMVPVDDEEAMSALSKLIDAIDDALIGIALRPGDICFMDNYLVVHGRRPFKARYDGTDRWLKRLNVASSLRLSRDARIGSAGRVIF